jgi:hypothetical protein
MNMDDIDELLESFRTLYARLEKLHQLEGPEFLLPERVNAYHSLLEDAYTAFGKIEASVDELGQQLEAEHSRLDKGVKKYGESSDQYTSH